MNLPVINVIIENNGIDWKEALIGIACGITSGPFLYHCGALFYSILYRYLFAHFDKYSLLNYIKGKEKITQFENNRE